MPRRNHRGTRTQLPKPKGGRVRSQSFWHAIASGIADGILSQEELTAKG